MSLAGRAARVAVFLGVVFLVVAITTAGSFLAEVGGEPPAPAEYEEYDASAIVPDRLASGGEPTVDRAADEGLVVVDAAHANRFRPDEIQPLVSAITDAGYRVEYVRQPQFLDDALARADALVVIDPGERYSTDDADSVEAFVDRGGRLVLLGEPTQQRIVSDGSVTRLESVHDRLNSLSTRFGVAFGSDYLFNMERNDGNFRSVVADATGDGPLVSGVDRTTFHAAVAVEGEDAAPLLVADDDTRTSRSDAAGEFAIAARSGNVVAVGDTSFLRRGNDDVLDNDAFVGNLATFLVSGDRQRTLSEYPANVDADPTIRYTGPELLEAAQTLREGQRGRSTLAQTRSSVPGDADVLVTTFDSLGDGAVEGTGVDVRGDVVSVPGYRSSTEGVAVLRSPSDGRFDLVIAADSPAGAERAATLLADGEIEPYLLDDGTAVVRYED